MTRNLNLQDWDYLEITELSKNELPSKLSNRLATIKP